MHALLRAALLLGGLVHATIGNPSGAAVLVSLQGTAGLHIEGKTHELAVSERDGELVFRVPLAGVDTGIGLRNKHMRGYLDAAQFPEAELRVPRTAVLFPANGKTTDADTSGVFTVHGVSKPCAIHYRAERTGAGEVRVRASLRIDMRDFGIAVPVYLGVGVEPAVAIEVDFSVHET